MSKPLHVASIKVTPLILNPGSVPSTSLQVLSTGEHGLQDLRWQECGVDLGISNHD